MINHHDIQSAAKHAENPQRVYGRFRGCRTDIHRLYLGLRK